MNTLTVPHVPESLSPYADSAFYETVEAYASRSLDDIIGTMPEPLLHNRYKPDEPAMDVVFYVPKDYDRKHAIVMPYPFGNGHTPGMHIRSELTHRVLGGDKFMMAVPNNVIDHNYYTLNAEQRAAVASGDARPIAAGILGTLEGRRVETIDILGYSQGAFVGAAIMQLAAERGVIEVKNVLLAEAPTVLERTPRQLKRTFTGTGMLPFIKAVKDSAIPALTEAQGMQSLLDAPQLLRGLWRVQKGSKLPENVALHEGMSKQVMVEVLEPLEFKRRESMIPGLTMARAEKSKVTPDNGDYAYIANYIAERSITIENYGHEAADNVSGVFALLAKCALQDSSAR